MLRTRGIPSDCLHRPTGHARVHIISKDESLGPHSSEESKRTYGYLIRKRIAGRPKEAVWARVEIATDLTVIELIVRYFGSVDGFGTSNEPENPADPSADSYFLIRYSPSGCGQNGHYRC